MKKAFKFTPTCMDDHKMLAAIPHFNKIFTTNYDTLLEDSYPESERDVVRNDDDCTYLNNPTAIIKVHGDFVFRIQLLSRLTTITSLRKNVLIHPCGIWLKLNS